MKKLIIGIFALLMFLSISPIQALAYVGCADLKGNYNIDFKCTSNCSGVFNHNMNLTIANMGGGTFSGTGYYISNPSTTWQVSGTFAQPTLTNMHIVYDSNGYTVDGSGTIASDCSMSGSAASDSGQTFVWSAVRNGPPQVPEFGLITGALAFVSSGGLLYFLKKRA